ncbi:hypothetical protein [Dactylosporangium sp. NPDC049140]|uniref:hypothetical protein n=1 Tax=Dactylosporangium sp. NPDC049140 TaxID=3155647 RepID=UPI0034040099
MLLLVLLSTTVAAGCGSSTPKQGGDGTDLHAAAVQVAECMRQKGYDLPDPTFDENDDPQFNEPQNLRGNEAYEAARADCRKPFNEAWLAAGRPNTKAQSRENLLVFAGCMRDHGVDVPDPDANGGWTLDKQFVASPAWQQAAEACRQLVPDAAGVPDLPGLPK